MLRPSVFLPELEAKGGAAVYVSDYQSNTVTIFSRAGKQTAQITGFSNPEGLTGDASGNIYVANSGGTTIDRYSADMKTLEAKLSDPGYHPADASVAPGTGIVGVANIASTTSGRFGSVVFYAKGSTKPCATVAASNWRSMYFVAFDAQGNLYVDGLSANSAALVGVVSGGCEAKRIVTLAGIDLFFPGGVQVAPSGNILIDDQAAAAVYTYQPPVNNTFGQPVATTSLGSGDPAGISLGSNAEDLYDADAELPGSQKFAYPAGSLLETFSPAGAQLPLGVYVNPRDTP